MQNRFESMLSTPAEDGGMAGKARKAVHSLVSAAAWIIAAGAAFVFFMWIFAPGELIVDYTPALTADAIITIVCYEAVAVSANRNGRRRGQLSEEYRNPKKEAETLSREILQTDVRDLSVYIDEFVATELERARRVYLAKHGIKLDLVREWQAWLVGESETEPKWKPDKHEQKLIRKAEKIKPVHITEDMLLCADGDARNRGAAPQSAKASQRVSISVSTVATVLIAVSTVAISGYCEANVSIATIVLFVVKLFGLITRLFGGMRSGEESYTVNGAAFCRWQVRHLTMFVAWRKAKEPAEDPAEPAQAEPHHAKVVPIAVGAE